MISLSCIRMATGRTWGAGHGNSYATDTNDAGQVVGYYRDAYGGVNVAFVWQDGVMTVLPGLSDLDTFAYGINQNGWIVGQSYTADGYGHAVVWQPVPELGSLSTLLCALFGFAAPSLRRKLTQTASPARRSGGWCSCT
jgi:probable HAF family extracellular repeat protein